jgi:hypothetical protein
MDILTQINIIVAASLAAQSFILLAIVFFKNGKPHYQAFFLFWGLFIVVASFLSYLMIDAKIKLPLQWDLAIDAVSIWFLTLAGYVLNRGDSFNWQDKVLPASFALFLAFEVLLVLFGIGIKDADLLWKVIYSSPSALAASATFIAVGIGVVRDPAAGALRWALLIIFVIYAILQPTNYYFEFIFGPDSDTSARAILRLFFAIGKTAIFVAVTVAAISFYEEKRAKALMSALKLAVGLVSVAFAIFVFTYRFLGFLHGFLPTTP